MFIKFEDTEGKIVHIRACTISGYVDLGETRVLYFDNFTGGLGVVDTIEEVEKKITDSYTTLEVIDDVGDIADKIMNLGKPKTQLLNDSN